MKLGKRNRGGVAPIYSVALLWLLWGLFLPLYSIFEYLPLIIAATVLYNVVKGVSRNTETETETPVQTQKATKTPAKEVKEVKTKSTGNPAVDALVKQRDEYVTEMRKLNLSIEDEKISAQINDMEYTTSKIYDYMIAHPNEVSQISQFQNYYLPTTIKLLQTYDRLSSQGIGGENITGTMQKVENTLDLVVEAFHKQLDTLFAGEALDVSADITVMENLMKSEGLSGEGDQLHLTL
ncbi:MAG: 5-bromo-4-chloroindolyl phosphate hydrolysis family protein [Oscillospiraceae bacterium]|nr:5-bromo-4-chloroindolyl phosphate hydrolysis family protein [Oscillospiraceae bacterium]